MAIEGDAYSRCVAGIEMLQFFEAVLYPEWMWFYFSTGTGKKILK